MTIHEMHIKICNNVVMDKGKEGKTLIGINDDLFLAKQF